MGRVFLKAERQFTARVGTGLLVGHPKHKDVRGRFFEADGADPQIAGLIAKGDVSKMTAAQYRKSTEGQEVSAGDVLVDQVAGKRGKVSARMTDAVLHEEARIRGVDATKFEKRHDLIRAINAKETSSAPEGADELNEDPRIRVSGSTNETTHHSRRASPQNAVGENGSVDIFAPTPEGGATEEADEIAEEEEAPKGGGGSKSK